MKIYSQSPLKITSKQIQPNKNLDQNFTANNSWNASQFPKYPANCSINTQKLVKTESFADYTSRPTMRDLEALKKENPSLLIKAYKAIERTIDRACFETSPKLTAECAYALKDLLDYTQEGNYKIISIGTSPEPIAFALENLGCKVVYLPMSGAGRLNNNMSTDALLKEHPNLETVMEYLKHNKVNAAGNEKIILLDYMTTGSTMSLLKKLLVENNGVRRDRIEVWDLECKIEEAKFLQEKFRGNYNFYKIEDKFRLHNDLGQQRTELYSKTPHFDVCAKEATNTGKRFEFFENHTNPTATAYQFCVLNELQKMRK